MRIGIVANTSWYLYNFRLTLMRKLISEGHEVIALSPSDAYSHSLTDEGIRHCPVWFHGSSTNPAHALRTILAINRIIVQEKIDLILSYTPKGNIYSSLAAALTKSNVICNISGLGRAFIQKSFLTILVKMLYRIGFRFAVRVFFQNADDMKLFLLEKLLPQTKADLLPGSGVNLSHFGYQALPLRPNDSLDLRKFLLVSRLLWSKGVGEYIEAAKRIKCRNDNLEFLLLGFVDESNSDGVPRKLIHDWHSAGIVRYLGETNDVRPYITDSDCVVLPTFYKEGVPRTLLESAAIGRAIITTNTSGCRDVVEHGITGFLIEPRSDKSLEDAINSFLALSREQQIEMGLRGRQRMIRLFDEQIVINKYISAIQQLAKKH